MKDLIVMAGSPGTGKSTVGELLYQRLSSVFIEFGYFREWHLDREWKGANPKEEEMAFENLIYVVNNYKRHGYQNIIITDLQDARVQQIPVAFENMDYIIFSLYVDGDDELEKRIVARNSGFKSVSAAVVWNRSLIQRPTLPNEYKINNTHNNPEQTLQIILQHLEGIL